MELIFIEGMKNTGWVISFKDGMFGVLKLKYGFNSYITIQRSNGNIHENQNYYARP
jgi:hypothetical protein